MAKQKIIRVRNAEEGWETLNYVDDYPLGVGCEKAPLGKPTADEYAELCDHEAENSNYHDFCGVHAALVKILRKASVDPLPVLRRIAEAGGLWQL